MDEGPEEARDNQDRRSERGSKGLFVAVSINQSINQSGFPDSFIHSFTHSSLFVTMPKV